jgi:hypothetical protein
MFTLQASIGRNIGDQPMSLRDWVAFANAVADAIRAGNEKPEVHFGSGSWNGVSEESAHVTIMRENAIDLPNIAFLNDVLGKIAARFGQDAIAVTIGVSTLITPAV